MSTWSKEKTAPENLNNGNEFVIGGNNSVVMINTANNNAFYAVDKSENTERGFNLLKLDITDVLTEFSTENTQFKTKLTAENTQFKTDVTTANTEFKTETTAEVDRLAQAIAEGGTQLKNEIGANLATAQIGVDLPSNAQMNAVRPIATGGTGATTAAEARGNLGAAPSGAEYTALWGQIGGLVTSQTDLSNVLNEKANINLSNLNLAVAFPSLKATNGYSKLPNGITMQWGRFTNTVGGQVAYTLPTAFTTTTYFVITKLRDTTNTSTSANRYFGESYTTTQFRHGSGVTGYDWDFFAVGY